MSGSSIDFDAILDLCRAKHRRIVLAVLDEARRSLTVADLTKAIVKHNHGTPLTEIPEEVVSKVSLALHHVHLPKLVEMGIVEYDPERNLVEPTEQFDELEPQLSIVIEADPELEPPLEL